MLLTKKNFKEIKASPVNSDWYFGVVAPRCHMKCYCIVVWSSGHRAASTSHVGDAFEKAWEYPQIIANASVFYGNLSYCPKILFSSQPKPFVLPLKTLNGMSSLRATFKWPCLCSRLFSLCNPLGSLAALYNTSTKFQPLAITPQSNAASNTPLKLIFFILVLYISKMNFDY